MALTTLPACASPVLAQSLAQSVVTYDNPDFTLGNTASPAEPTFKQKCPILGTIPNFSSLVQNPALCDSCQQLTYIHTVIDGQKPPSTPFESSKRIGGHDLGQFCVQLHTQRKFTHLVLT
ncbi:hypothetical protein J3R83DRAFT_12915 [Lanmaoa asiatica]|nr:hypothetical protein J3R83DRAFT_12915 [Lanmaoa asiatica]